MGVNRMKKHKDLNISYYTKSIMAKEGSTHIDISELKISNEYRKLVEDADKFNQDFFIDNSTIEHAKFLILKLINRAKTFIRIFTDNLSEVYYSNHIILETLKEKLNKNIEVEIITRNKTESKEFMELQKQYKNNLKLYTLKDKTDMENHFLLVDDASFRIESPHSKKDIAISDFKVDAKVNFYNEEVGGLLRGLFEDLKSQSTPQN